MRTAYLLAAFSLTTLDLAAQSELAKAMERYRNAVVASQRIAALQAVSKLDTGRTPAKEITQALARGFLDPLTDVRVRTVALVAAAPHRDTAMSALLGECRRIVEALKSIPLPKVEGRSIEEALAKNPDIAKEMQAVIKAIDAVMDKIKTMDPLIDELSRIKDDRSVEGLALLLPVAGPGEKGDRILSGLLAFSTRAALVAVAQNVSVLDKPLVALKKHLSKVRREKLRKMPKYWKGSAKLWRDREKARIAQAVAGVEANVRQALAVIEDYTNKVRAYARERGLPPPPRGKTPWAWKSWGVRAGNKLPLSVR